MKLQRIFITAFTLGFIALTGSLYSRSEVLMTKAESHDISNDKYTYHISKPLEKSPDTFEAWIKLPKDLADSDYGGVIMGNFYSSSGYLGSINWEVSKKGKFRIFWNRIRSYIAEVDYTFENYDLRTGKWEHIALVRNPIEGSFSYYVNGALNEKIYAASSSTTSAMKFAIGVDQTNWLMNTHKENFVKSNFRGEIRQIAIYNGPITPSKIKEDMNNDNILPSPQFDLIGSWNMGDWSKNIVEDSSLSDNDLILKTYEKYIDVEETEDYDYTIVGMPDIQITVHWHEPVIDFDYDWLVNNRYNKNIQYILHVGDLVDNASDVQWEAVRRNFNKLVDNEIQFGFVPGNHDYDDGAGRSRPTTMYNKYLPYSKYSKLPYFGGALYEGSMDNYYNIVNIDGIDYLFMNLEFGPRDCSLDWANRIVEEYPNHRVIVTTHHNMEPNGTVATKDDIYNASKYGIGKGNSVNDPYQVFDKFVKQHQNIFMVFSGHTSYDDIVHRVDEGVNGNKIHQILIDAQGSMATSKDGFTDVFAIMKVNEAKKKMYIYWYSPYRNQYLNIQNQFVLDFADENNPTIGPASEE